MDTMYRILEPSKKVLAMRKWQENNREKTRVLAKAFYWENKYEINERRRKNPNSLFHTIRRNARIRGIELNLSKEEFIDWWKRQEQICSYCDIPVSRLSIVDRKKKLSQRLSIDRLDNSKGYSIENITLSCLQCNFIKSNLFSFAEMREIGQRFIKPKWNK